MSNLADRYLFIKKVVKDAGILALDYYQDRQQLDIEKKSGDGQDLVTVADRTTEDFIQKQINTYYPQDAIFGEESGLAGDNSGCTWVIDPIDGTSAFIFGLPSWCISVAFLDEQKILSLTPTSIIGNAFVGLAALAAIASMLSWQLIKNQTNKEASMAGQEVSYP